MIIGFSKLLWYYGKVYISLATKVLRGVGMASDDFFEKPREQSLIKTEIILKYLPAWKNVIKRYVVNREGKLGYIDLFSGPGKYTDGTESTPILVLKDAIEAMTLNMVSRKVYVIDREGKLLGMITTETLMRQVGYKVGVREAGVISFFKFVTGIFKENVTEFMETPVTVSNKHKVLDALKKMVEYHHH